MKMNASLCGFLFLASGIVSARNPQAGRDHIIGELLASDASLHGSVVLTGKGTSLESGTAVDTGSSVATIALKRGGAVRICPGSSVTVNEAEGGNPAGGLMMSLDHGALEAAYSISTKPDAIITPDFRIVLAGPAEFHFAIAASANGDTCVRPTSGNSGAIIVNELIGGGTYQVKPGESIIFRGGKVSGAAESSEACGCPAPMPVEVAAEKPVPPAKAEPAPVTVPTSNETAPVPAPKAGQVEVQVDAPFVFSAIEPQPPVAQVASLHFQGMPALPLTAVAPPPAASAPAPPAKPVKKGFFGHIGSFFSSLFRHKSPPQPSS